MRIKYASIVNILGNKLLVKEFLQGEATAENISLYIKDFRDNNKKGFDLRNTWRPLHSLKIFKDCPSDNMENSMNFFNKSVNLPSSPILNLKIK